MPITPFVSGVQTGSDPVHQTEIYYGSPKFNNTNDMLINLGVIFYPQDKFSYFPDPSLGLGSKMIIQRATPVVITDAGQTTTYRTWAKDIQGLLAENNIELLGQDTAEPAVSTPISSNLTVKITRVAEVDVAETQAIDFKIVQKQSADLEKGQTKIETKGAKGQKEVTYTIKRIDGIEVSRVLKSSQITKEPVTQIVIIGIGPKLVHSGLYQDYLNQAAKRYLVNATALQSLMMCESTGHVDSGYPNGKYQGLFQYDPNFWPTASKNAGFEGASILDAKAQIFTTAYYISIGQSSRWPPWTKGCPSNNYTSCKNL